MGYGGQGRDQRGGNHRQRIIGSANESSSFWIEGEGDGVAGNVIGGNRDDGWSNRTSRAIYRVTRYYQYGIQDHPGTIKAKRNYDANVGVTIHPTGPP